MPDKKISELVELTEPAVADELAIVDKDISETKKITLATLDVRYVNVTGDTMTGGLLVEPTTDTLTALVVNDTDSNNVLTVDTINNRVTMGGDVIGTDFVRTRDGAITRVSGYVSEVALTGGRTLTVTRNASNFITSITDTIRTWTYTRDANDYIISWAVT